MSKSEQYATNASECLRMARVACRSDQKQSWLWLGQSWLAMAASIGKANVH
jgi:hypothetical protein